MRGVQVPGRPSEQGAILNHRIGAIMATTELMPVEFAGATLYIINQDGIPFTPMKPIVEAMGLDWAGQFTKLKSNSTRWGIGEISIPSNGGEQSMSCLPLRKLPGWMMTIHPNKVKDSSVRERIVRYQNECDDVLWDYWNKAKVQPVLTSDKISPAQRQHLRELVQIIADSGKQSHGETWNRLHRKFKINEYKELPATKFDEAVSYLQGKMDGQSMAALVQKHFPDAVKALPAPAQAELDLTSFSLLGVRLLISHDHTGREVIQRVPHDAMLATWDDIAHIMRDHFLMPSTKQLVSIVNAGVEAMAKRSGYGKSEMVAG